nr:hypothetical protein [Tanacetum cinerariifolium]
NLGVFFILVVGFLLIVVIRVYIRRFNPYSNPHIGANMCQETFFDATAMNVQSAQTKDVAGGYVFNSTPIDSYRMPATRVNLVESGVTSDGSPNADNNNADVNPCKVLHADDSINLNVDESQYLVTLSFSLWTSIPSQHPMLEPGASANDQPKVNSNLCTLVADPAFDGVNISIPRKVVKKVSTRFEHALYGYFIRKRMAFPVVEYFARNNWAKHGLKRIMMNSKGFFFFKFDSRASLEAVLEGGPWLIRKSPIILKKWSMDTRLLKEELTRISIWVKLHDVPIQFFLRGWHSSSFTWCLIEINSEADFVDVVTIGIPSLSGDGFTKETIRVVSPLIFTTSNVVTPTFEKINDGFQTVGKKKKKKGKSKSTNSGQFVGLSIKQNVRYEPKESISAPKKGVTNVGNTSQSSSMLKTTDNSSNKDNLSISNSFSTLNDKEEYVENVYHESANLIQNTKVGGSSSFMAAVVEGDGALGSLGAFKASTHHVITMFLYPLRAVEVACALEVDAMRALDLVEAVGALDLVEVEAVVALDVVGLSLNIIISESLSGYLTSLYQTKSSSPKKPSSLDTSTTSASSASFPSFAFFAFSNLLISFKNFLILF